MITYSAIARKDGKQYRYGIGYNRTVQRYDVCAFEQVVGRVEGVAVCNPIPTPKDLFNAVWASQEDAIAAVKLWERS